MAFAILGGISGVIAGSSSEPLVGGLVTGVIGIVSALLSYAFAQATQPHVQALIPPMIVLLLLNVLGGLSVGQNWREKWDNYHHEMAEYRSEFNDVWIPVTREYQLEILRRCLAANTNFELSRQLCRYEILFTDPAPGAPANSVAPN